MKTIKEFICNDMSVTTAEIHISNIKSGDTVYHNGELKTVCRNNIKYDSFMGHTFRKLL